MQDIHYAQFLADTLYGVETLPEDFEELALVAYRMIGNKRSQFVTTCLPVDCDGMVMLPCSYEELEAVTWGFEDWNHVTNKHVFGDLQSQFTEHWIEGQKRITSPFYLPGKYVDYVPISENVIQIKNPIDKIVYILYWKENLDENDLPMITDEEAIAIATFVAYTSKFKEAMITNNKDIMEVSRFLQTEWNRRCDAARVPTHLSQNDGNAILNVKSSWDRKQYDKSYKPIK